MQENSSDTCVPICTLDLPQALEIENKSCLLVLKTPLGTFCLPFLVW